MNSPTYNLKLKGEQKWLQSDRIYFYQETYLVITNGAEQIFKANESKRVGRDSKNAEIRQMLSDFETVISEIKTLWLEMEGMSKILSPTYGNSNFLMFNFPKLKTCTRLNDAYVGTTEINTVISNVQRVIECYTQIKDKIKPFVPLYSCVQVTPNSAWDSKTAIDKIQDFFNTDPACHLKEIHKLDAQLSSGAIEVESKNAENSFRNKTSWAIFARHPNSNSTHVGGYLDKHKAEGDISTARLFDSDVGALKTAKAMRLQANTYDIVEVEIQFKKRTNLVPGFHNNAISELEAIIEKEKIEDMFESFGVDKIEAKLSEIKQKNKNKL